ncbi:MAG: RNA polymerase sigma factor [Acidobacteriota bacterium]|nr:RNA polymerase sigma factor [Acidobacteriota bacterium]
MAEDRELVVRCLAGEAPAWEELLQAHHRKIYNLCYRFTGNLTDSEDLTQEIFIKIFQTLRSYDAGQSQFSTWLNRIARNHLVDHYRRTRHDRANPSLDDEDESIHPRAGADWEAPAEVEARERQELLQAALARLSPDMREVVILRDLQDLDYAEIVQVLGVPEGTVKSRLNRGRMELARVLKRMLSNERLE